MQRLRNLLEESHKDLKQWFLFHQECLLLAEDEWALKAFSIFSDYLLKHLAFENAFLLSSSVQNLRWPVNVYQKEHDKLLLMQAKSEVLLNRLVLLDGRRRRLFLLELLDQQQSFMHVMEHHEEREEQDLFLHIQESSSALEQWIQIDNALTQEHQHAKQQLKKLLETR